MGPRRVFVIGMGMTNFQKPQKDPAAKPQFPDLGKEAVERALTDACVAPDVVDAAYVGCMFNTGAGQRVLYDCGIHNVPVTNVNNACATGSNALALARQSVMAGVTECALALGVEKMAPGSLGGGAPKGATMLDHHYRVLYKDGIPKAPPMAVFFGKAGEEHMKEFPTVKPEHFAMIGEKNHRHSINNPYSQFRDVYKLEEIQNAPKVYGPLTKLQCSPTSDGAAAALIASEDFVVKNGLQGQAIEIIAQSVRTDTADVFSGSNRDLIGRGMCQAAAADVYRESGLTPNDVQVVELHDCFSANELITTEALGLAEPGKGGELVASGNATFGGKYVINPSGGLISKGHPLAATGIAQCSELCWQLRGECGPRQVDGAKVALQHNLGLGGLCVVTMYKKPEEWASAKPKRAQSLAMGPPAAAKL